MSNQLDIRRIVMAANTWRDANNPLRGLTMPRAVSLMEQYQRGIMADIQWLYAAETGIEATDPDLMALIERTVSGVADLDWQVVSVSPETAGFDQALADEQAAFLRESYARCDNLDDALEHLVMARFRGYAHLAPHLAPDWTLEHLEILPQWNMVRNGSRSEWAWNPEAQNTGWAAVRRENILRPADYIVLENRRPVNRIALIKYVRANVAEKDWDSYVEIYGLPAVFIVMPPTVPGDKVDEYAQMAKEASEAYSGTLPPGSDVKTLSEVRSIQPYQPRLEYLQRQLVLAGTGGLLTMLTAAGSGTLAGGAHAQTWEIIIRRIAYLVARPFQTQYEKRALAARFPGRPALAYFDLRARQEKDVSKAIANIVALAAAGYRPDPEQVTKETGYDVEVVSSKEQGVSIAACSRRDAGAQGLLQQFNPVNPVNPVKENVAKSVLNEIAKKILDGSVPFETALVQAQSVLGKLTPGMVDVGELEEQITAAMMAAAAEATEGEVVRRKE